MKKIIYIGLFIIPLWIGTYYVAKDYNVSDKITALKLKVKIAERIFKEIEFSLLNILMDAHNMVSLYYEEHMDEELKENMLKILKEHKLDVFLLTDTEGKVVVRANNLDIYDDELTKTDFLIKQVLLDKTTHSSLLSIDTPRLRKERLKNDLLLEVAIPLRAKTGRLLGALVNGYTFPNPIFNKKVQEAIGDEVLLSKEVMYKEPHHEVSLNNKQVKIYEPIIDTRNRIVGNLYLKKKIQPVSNTKKVCLISSLLSVIYLAAIISLIKRFKLAPPVAPDSRQTQVLSDMQDKIKNLEKTLKDISLPVVLKLQNLVVLVFLSHINPQKTLDFLKYKILPYITEKRPKTVILDLERLNIANEEILNMLDFITKSLHLCGCEVKVCGLSAEFIKSMMDKEKTFQDFVKIDRDLISSMS